MGRQEFGDDNFTIAVEDFEVDLTQRAHSQLKLVLHGVGWVLAGNTTESLGVAVPRLIEFGRNGQARHWGAFAGLKSYDAVANKVKRFAFGSSEDTTEDLHRWEASSGMGAYALSAVFDYNLGVEIAVAVRGFKAETIIALDDVDVLMVVDIPVASFDLAIAGLNGWLEAIWGSRRPEDGWLSTRQWAKKV